MDVRRRRFVILGVLALLPLCALALWAASGRERLSKSGKIVTIQERDVFGDLTERPALVRGPVFGYYVGLDWVAGAAAVWLVASTLTLWLTRHKAAANVHEGC